VEEAYASGLLGEKILGKDFNLDITVHRGAGAYICGEETGLISSLEGYKGFPKLKPPFPAVEGAFGCPTVVNNVETLCFLPWIILEGNQSFLKYGSEKNPGTRMFCISGQVKKPGIYELPMGTTIKDLVFIHGGGLLDGRKLKAVIPGGASASWLTPDEIETKADFDSLRTVGSMAGSGGVIVMDDTVCAVKAITRIAKFFAHESCGQCTPCREGTDWSYKILKKILAGQATWKDVDLLVNVCTNMAGKTICVLSDAAADPIKCVVKKFRADFVPYIEGGRRSRELHPWVTEDPMPAMSLEASAAQHAPTHTSPMGGK
jgi:NADH-quinone oxidoreductase subunit F